MANTTITPGGGSVRLTTNAVITPLVAAVALASAAQLLNLAISPSTAITTLSSGASSLALGLQVSGASVGVSGNTATLSFGSAIGPLTGSVTFNSDQSALSIGTAIPGAASIVLTGNSPVTMIPNQTLTTSTGSLRAVGNSPLIGGASPPATYSLTLSGLAPSLRFVITLTSAGTGVVSVQGAGSQFNLGIAPPSGPMVLTTAIFHPIIAPSAGAVVLAGNVPTLSGSVGLSPGSGVLSFAGNTPPVALTVPAPPSAALIAGGAVPSLTQTHILPITGGSVTLAGAASQVIQGSVIIAPNGTVLVGTSNPPGSPVLALNLLTSSSGLQLTASAPLPSISTVLTPAVTALTLAGNVPTGIPGGSVAPGAGTITFGGASPALSPGLVPAVATLALSSGAATLNYGIAPNAASLAIAGAAPTVNGRVIIAPLSASLSFTAAQPIQGAGLTPSVASISYATSATSMGLAVTIGVGNLTFATIAPFLSTTGVPQTQTGSVSLSGLGPSLNLTIPPKGATVVLSGQQASVNSLTTIRPSTGVTALASDPGDVAQIGVILPGTAAMALSSDGPTIIRSGFAAPATATITFGSDVPLVYQTTNGFVVPGTANVVLDGQPAVIPLYKPDPYHTVQSPGPDRYTVYSPG